jgi:hypothetical protein
VLVHVHQETSLSLLHVSATAIRVHWVLALPIYGITCIVSIALAFVLTRELRYSTSALRGVSAAASSRYAANLYQHYYSHQHRQQPTVQTAATAVAEK